MIRTAWLPVACLLIALTARVPVATAQTSPVYVQFEPFTVKGALYRPGDSARDVAVLLIHRVNNDLGHLAARELSMLDELEVLTAPVPIEHHLNIWLARELGRYSGVFASTR